MEYRTCTYIHDDGGICNSAAVTDRNLCLYHLRHRARLMRMAQYRARGERFDLHLPPLESMHAVQSALTQLSEALAADMIGLKRADRLIRVLNIASRNLLKSDKWPASPYHSAGSPSLGAPPLSPSFGDRVGAVDLTAEYGLPNDLDLNAPPELAFPPPPKSLFEGAPPLSPVFGDRVGTHDESNDPFVSALRAEGILGDLEFRPDYPVTPEFVELNEIQKTQGSDASAARSAQMMRNERRRRFRSERKRYAEIAAQINLQRAAERLAERKLAERDTQTATPAKKPPASTTGDAVVGKEAATA